MSSVGFDQLAECVARARELASLQLTGQTNARAANARRRELRDQLQVGLLRYLVRVGEAVARELPNLVATFELPRLNTNIRSFLIAAGGMLAEAQTHRERFVRLGLTESLLDELADLLDQFTTAVEQANGARQQHVGASADLDAVAAEIVELVERMDPLNQHRFRQDPDALAAWDSARNVIGPTHHRPVEPPPGMPPADGAQAA